MEGLPHIIDCWIRRYQPKNKREQQLLKSFHEQLRSVKTLQTLHALLTDYYNPSKTQEGDKLQLTFHRWLTYCVNVHDALETTLPILEKIQDNTGLVKFCQRLLDTPKALLHNSILPILSITRDKKTLETLLVFMQELPDNPNPISTNPATFEAQIPTDDLHRAMIQLLRNNSYQMSESCQSSYNQDLLDSSNGLLQALLIVHQDCQTSLTPIPERVGEISKTTCALM